MKRVMGAALCALLAGGIAHANAETKLTIATVNNGDMIRMQKLTAAPMPRRNPWEECK